MLMRLRCPRLDVNPVLNLVFLPHYAYLIAGCEDGLFAWKITDLRLEKREREPDMELKLDVDHEVCIDGLAQVSDNALALKVVEAGEIMIFDFASILERRKVRKQQNSHRLVDISSMYGLVHHLISTSRHLLLSQATSALLSIESSNGEKSILIIFYDNFTSWSALVCLSIICVALFIKVILLKLIGKVQL
ncbi:unnamed protein product [Protopolystoma xenopodis]|uniref:Uncharacterized protein n=1 Tax=Protopolystoma xenopodis TaxID=117903 RepID=A0A448X3E6_9PLAT|nr:unnamed protein product [Protopolystoma xenopodis]